MSAITIWSISFILVIKMELNIAGLYENIPRIYYQDMLK